MTPSTAALPPPTRTPIRARRLGLTIDPATPRHWFAGDPVVTRLLDTLSLTFPDGEQFFVDSVRRFREHALDEGHAADIAGFVAQETQHSLEHRKWNEHLATQPVGEVAAEAEVLARKLLKGARFRLSHKEQLAATAALEHVTAVLAEAVLSDDVLASMDPAVAPLWMWHAIEEIEHKSVAFDLHRAIGGSHTQRRLLLVLGTVYLVAFTAHFTRAMLRADGVARDRVALAKGLVRLFGPRGVVSRALPAYLAFYERDFHPEQQDSRALLARRKAELERLRGLNPGRHSP